MHFGVFFSRILRRSGFASRFDEKLIFFHFSQRWELFFACFEEETAFSVIFLKRFASRFDETLKFFHFSQRREFFLASFEEETAF